jgi:hypothetical protein
MSKIFKDFVRHVIFLHSNEMESYELSDESVDENLVDVIQNIQSDIEDGSETPETAFFHAYVFSMQINGRYEGYDTVSERKEIESLHELTVEERKEVLSTLDEALVLYREALAYDAGLQESWVKIWSELKTKLKNTKKLFAENNQLIFKL